jgi:uncharacterized membrane protein
MKTTSPRQLRPRLSLLVGLISLLSCTEQAPTSPGDEQPAGASGGSGPTVRATVPSSAPRDTTLDVLVRGSGFDRESRAVWALDGTQTANVTTNSTAFLSPRELSVNITISADADLALYDVEVLAAGGKKGIGIEIFEVTLEITTLPMLGGGTSASADGINNAGIVVGQAVDEQERFHAVRWRRQRNIWTIETLPGGLDAVAQEINNKGTIAGYRTSSHHAVLWTTAGRLVDLGLGFPFDINEQDVVVGARQDFDNSWPTDRQAMIWTKTSPTTWSTGERLPRLPGGLASNALAINAAGTRIAGDAWDSDSIEHAVRWDLVGGRWQGPKIIADGRLSAVTAINHNGEMAGSGFPCSDLTCGGRAMFWTPNETRTVLFPEGTTFTIAGGLSSSGDVVGFAGREDFTRFAFSWSPRRGQFRDIGLLLGDLEAAANDMNDQRQAVGHSLGERGSQVWLRPVLWTLRH